MSQTTDAPTEARQNQIPPEVRRFANDTGASGVRSCDTDGMYRVDYEDGSDIIHLGEHSEIPDGYEANAILGGANPTIDLFE